MNAGIIYEWSMLATVLEGCVSIVVAVLARETKLWLILICAAVIAACVIDFRNGEETKAVVEVILNGSLLILAMFGKKRKGAGT